MRGDKNNPIPITMSEFVSLAKKKPWGERAGVRYVLELMNTMAGASILIDGAWYRVSDLPCRERKVVSP